jgi:hypothetical protein
MGSFIQILEHIIMLEEVFKTHPGKTPIPIKASHIPALSFYTETLLSKITDSMNRDCGDGFNLIKFHLIMHMVRDDIMKYGLSRNISGSPGESQFKKNFKLPAETTQKRKKTFEQQCCIRHFQNMTVKRCKQIIARTEQERRSRERDEPLAERFGRVLSLHTSAVSKDLTPSLSGKVLSAGVYSVLQTRASTSPHKDKYQVDIVFKGKADSARSSKFPTCTKKEGYMVGRDGKLAGPRHTLGLKDENASFSAITEFLLPVVQSHPDMRIRVYTNLKVPKTHHQKEDVLYRADPFCAVSQKERHDWALIQWEDENNDQTQVPGQVLGFLDVDQDLMNAINHSHCTADVSHTGKYAMVYSMKDEIQGLMDPTVTELDSDHVMQTNSVLMFWGEKELDDDDRPRLRLVDVECFLRPLIVIPDFDPVFKDPKKTMGINVDHWVRSESRKNAFIVLRPRDLWHATFLELAKEHYRKRNHQRDD